MRAFPRALSALLLIVLCLPVLADDCPPITSFRANDVQTGEPVTFTWSYAGGAAPQSQTLSGHDFDPPVVLGPDVRSYTYTPSKPGEKHAQLATVMACGTVSTSTKYKVKQCNVVAPAMTVDATSVAPGAEIHASIELAPGHTARWEVTNGTASATSGSAITVTAGSTGPVTINAWVSRGSSCAVLSTASIEVVDACPIAEPQVYHPEIATADNFFYLFVDQIPAGQSLSFEVHGTTIDFQDEQSVYMTAPSAGSFSIDVIVTNGTCTRTFTYSFTVQACHAAVVVRPGQQGACGYETAIAEFSGTPPFQGNWSDGEYFYTYEMTLERPISGGTYSIPWVFDQYCQAQGTGSVTAGSTLPTPSYTIDPIVNGSYWGNDTCPGTVRTATLDGAVPAGATVEWSIPGGTIVSGQGTPVVQYTGDTVGPTNLSVVFRDPNGCDSAPYSYPYAHTLGTPQAVLHVEPSTIPAGGTAMVTVEFLGYFTGGYDLSSSLGDPLVYVGPGNQFEYRSTHGGGIATITLNASNFCASGSATTTLTIDGGTTVQATAKVRAIGNSCGSYAAYAEFTGVAPFTGTWSNGYEFTTNDPLSIVGVQEPGTYTLTSFADANGPGTITGDATFDFETLPQPEIALSSEAACLNSVITASITSPLPEGATVEWNAYNAEILSGQGTPSIELLVNSEYAGVFAQVSAPNACAPGASKDILVQTTQQPAFTTYGVYENQSTQFDVILDPNTTEWHFENSMGDAMEIIGNPAPNVYTLRYTSSHGPGSSYIRIYGTSSTCGQTFDVTGVMQVFPPPPTVTLTTSPADPCGSYVTATFTGSGPFSGFWADGQTFTTSETSITRFFSGYEFVYVYVTDAFGGAGQSEYITTQPKLPDPVAITGATSACLGQQVTITADLPAGWTILWRVAPDPADLSYGLRIVSGENSASVVVEGILPERGILNPVISTPEGCTRYQDWYVDVTECSGQ